MQLSQAKTQAEKMTAIRQDLHDLHLECLHGAIKLMVQAFDLKIDFMKNVLPDLLEDSSHREKAVSLNITINKVLTDLTCMVLKLLSDFPQQRPIVRNIGNGC